METITLEVGTVTCINGRTQEHLRPVEFVGEKLASRREYTGDNDTRGVDETLYRCEDGRLVVYVEDWSRWQGEPDTYRLVPVVEADLGPNGRFEYLGQEAGMGRALTLDEALAADDGE